MSDDITARLREHPTFLDTRSCREAADEIDRNRATLHMQATMDVPEYVEPQEAQPWPHRFGG